MRFDRVMLACCAWLVSGLFIDGWVHFHLVSATETFFTPWHALLYSGFLARIARLAPCGEPAAAVVRRHRVSRASVGRGMLCRAVNDRDELFPVRLAPRTAAAWLGHGHTCACDHALRGGFLTGGGRARNINAWIRCPLVAASELGEQVGHRGSRSKEACEARLSPSGLGVTVRQALLHGGRPGAGLCADACSAPLVARSRTVAVNPSGGRRRS